ncbi:MAG: type III-B CRISPR module RAMP protein Cmr6 [Ignavibacteria bacterium]|nr:type III-B CRISPR module RAMP protein Cmr6 [Ignavibacteria bacterium]
MSFFNAVLSGYESYTPADLGNKRFEATTLYPGLLVGSGYNHEIGKQRDELKQVDELKLGFFFDHTSGLPCIPGSSVKGILRHAFEIEKGEYVLSVIEEIQNKERTIESPTLFEIDKIKAIMESKNNKASPFVSVVFDGRDSTGKYLPLKDRDIFFDAFPVKSGNQDGVFLKNDYITHHENKFKNPNPVQFLKVLPEVTFRFPFRLTDEPVKADVKLELFRQIILDLGAGARTNVGYGQFKPALLESATLKT